MLTIVRSNRFLKDLRLAKKRGLDLTLLEHIVLQAFGAKRESFQRSIELSFCNT